MKRIRDEAQRFAITYSRKERRRIKSKPDSIPGGAPARCKVLLHTFGSVPGVAKASVEQLMTMVGWCDDLER